VGKDVFHACPYPLRWRVDERDVKKEVIYRHKIYAENIIVFKMNNQVLSV
jgi:hypothetical protein